MSKSLPRCPPIDKDVDPAAVLAFVEAIDADKSTELHSLMVLRHGHVVAEGWWAPHTPERPRLLYSLSKSFTSTALGIAVGEGLVDLDDTVVSHFPEFADDITDPGSRSITLRHVVSMASGHNRDMMDEALQLDPHEPVRGFLMVPPDEEPGTVFAYSQPCTYTVAECHPARGRDAAERVPATAAVRSARHRRSRLADLAAWAGAGVQRPVRPYRRHRQTRAALPASGSMGDDQLIPERYVVQATSRQIDTPGEGEPRLAPGLRLPVLDVPAWLPR